MAIILDMSCLTFSNVNTLFANWKLIWKLYTTAKALTRIKRLQIIGQKKFAALALESSEKAFVMHVAHLKTTMLIYPAEKAQIALLMAKKVNILVKHLAFANVFLKKLAAELFEDSNINKHLIDLKPGKQPPYRPIYSLGQVN